MAAFVTVRPYLDDGRWWSDAVVAVGCMVLCLATCVLIIAELGVCRRQEQLLQLQTNKTQREKDRRGIQVISSYFNKARFFKCVDDLI